MAGGGGGWLVGWASWWSDNETTATHGKAGTLGGWVWLRRCSCVGECARRGEESIEEGR